jgi:hypothetical protein
LTAQADDTKEENVLPKTRPYLGKGLSEGAIYTRVKKSFKTLHASRENMENAGKRKDVSSRKCQRPLALPVHLYSFKNRELYNYKRERERERWRERETEREKKRLTMKFNRGVAGELYRKFTLSEKKKRTGAKRKAHRLAPFQIEQTPPHPRS